MAQKSLNFCENLMYEHFEKTDFRHDSKLEDCKNE